MTTPIAFPTPSATLEIDPNEGFIVVKEWGLRFKVSATITDVQYASDYLKVEDGRPVYALGYVYRSTNSAESKMGDQVQGKKIGNKYYYTAWAFSSMATGAGCVRVYDIKDDEAQCLKANQVFKDMNMGDTALINTIEAVR